MRRAWILLFVVLAAAGCPGNQPFTPHAPDVKPEVTLPGSSEKLLGEAATAAASAVTDAEALHARAPAEMKTDFSYLVGKARAVVVAIQRAMQAVGTYEMQATMLLGERNRLLAERNALAKENAELRAANEKLAKDLADAESKRRAATALWFIALGGVVFAAGAAVAIWVDVKAGMLAGTFGAVLCGIGLALQFIASNPWLLWGGALLGSGVIVYLVWKSGALARVQTAFGRVVSAVDQYEPESATAKPDGLKAAILMAAGSDEGIVRAEVSAAKDREGIAHD